MKTLISDDSINNLRRLLFDLLSDPCFRAKEVPTLFGIDDEINKELENLDSYIEFLKDEIKRLQEIIIKLENSSRL